MEYGWLSLIPALAAVGLAFITREAIFSLACGCLAGVLIMGRGLAGFPELLIQALTQRDFIWILLVEVFIGILIAFFQRAGAVRLFTKQAGRWARSRRRTTGISWGLGMFIFFSDYFSPLFVGPIMRDLTDRARVSREKLAYVCDSTSAPLLMLAPITASAAYVCGLMVGAGPIDGLGAAMTVYLRSIPLNFYCILAVALAGLICFEIVPDFGPMRRAERRARERGEVLRPGSTPMMSEELTGMQVSDSPHTSIGVNLILPVAVVVGFNAFTFVTQGRARVLESFMTAVGILAVILLFQKVDNLRGMMATVTTGIKGVIPAVLILAFAFTLNTVSREMGTAAFVVENTRHLFHPAVLPVLVFLICAFISFATGTAWGTYAVMTGVAMPLAVEFAGGMTGLVPLTAAALVGGGIFGDHCSPLSDTTVLSSLGSACDHMDHVRTQLPYALAAAAGAALLFLIAGLLTAG